MNIDFDADSVEISPRGQSKVFVQVINIDVNDLSEYAEELLDVVGVELCKEYFGLIEEV